MADSILAAAVKRAGYEAIEALLAQLTPKQLEQVKYEWQLWARPEQLAPAGDWLVWLLLAGRGFGKTRTGAEYSRGQAHAFPGSHGALIAPTAADARDVMAKALLQCSPPWEGCVYESSKRRITWRNGSTATLYSAEEPDRLRGPQHHWAWADEVAAWQYAEDTWDMLMFGLRMGDRPRVVVSTTPRPIPLVRRLIKDKGTVVTRGSTFDNSANLAASFIQAVKARYDGTRLGRQELYAEVLDDVEGALWNHTLIDKTRRGEPPTLKRVVVAVDPAGSAKKEADITGIVVAGIGDCPCLGRVEAHGFVLEDLSSRYNPADMAATAIAAYHKYEAHRLVGEDNFGGKIIEDLVKLTDRTVAYRAVHASRGKIVRAEPVAGLYEQGKVHHVGRELSLLEDEMCQYAPLISTESPGRLDALVWALSDLMLGQGNATFGDIAFKSPRRTF